MRVIILSLTALCLATSVSAAPGAVEGPRRAAPASSPRAERRGRDLQRRHVWICRTSRREELCGPRRRPPVVVATCRQAARIFPFV